MKEEIPATRSTFKNKEFNFRTVMKQKLPFSVVYHYRALQMIFKMAKIKCEVETKNISGGGNKMKSHTEYLEFNTTKRREYINITGKVKEILGRSGIREGMALVSAMHITAGVYVNDAEEGIIQDIDNMLEEIAPFGPDYLHHRTGEDNGDAHLKSILVHHQVIVPVTNGRLDLGPWQEIYYAEFDGRRRKRVVVKIIGE